MHYFYIDPNYKLSLISDTPKVLPQVIEVEHEYDEETFNQDDSEFVLAVLRKKRDLLLIESDGSWIESKSRGQATVAIETYKQELRDLPAIDLTGKTLIDIPGLLPTKP